MAEEDVRFLSERPLRKGRLKGWKHTQSAETRHRHLEEAIREYGYKETEHALGALVTADKNRDPEVSEIARRDEHWVAERRRDEERRDGRGDGKRREYA